MANEHRLSDEEIMARLTVWGETTSEDERNTAFIKKTLLHLPEEIRLKVLDEVIFLHTTAHGTIFKMLFPEEQEQAFILLNFTRVKDEEKMDTIAHEIAHYILGHDISGDLSAEKDADDLTEKWGFKRAYKKYDV